MDRRGLLLNEQSIAIQTSRPHFSPEQKTNSKTTRFFNTGLSILSVIQARRAFSRDISTSLSLPMCCTPRLIWPAQCGMPAACLHHPASSCLSKGYARRHGLISHLD